jgi:hypothetical protein
MAVVALDFWVTLSQLTVTAMPCVWVLLGREKVDHQNGLGFLKKIFNMET